MCNWIVLLPWTLGQPCTGHRSLRGTDFFCLLFVCCVYALFLLCRCAWCVCPLFLFCCCYLLNTGAHNLKQFITINKITAVAPQTAGKGGMAAVQMLNNSVQDNTLSLAEDLLKSGTNPIPMGPSQNTGNNFSTFEMFWEQMMVLGENVYLH